MGGGHVGFLLVLALCAIAGGSVLALTVGLYLWGRRREAREARRVVVVPVDGGDDHGERP